MGATKGLPQRGGRVLFVLALLAAVVAAPAGAADKNPPGDPPGNNGTVKIERDGPADEDKGNEPIGDGCLIWLEYYGFDQGQTADITFSAHPPSGTGELVADKAVPISDDAAGGGQDKDAVIAYDLTSAVQGLKAHPKQGYHIKLRSDSLQAPGGAKQKVFWIKCTPAPATTLRVAKATKGAGSGPFAFEVRCNHRPANATFTLDAGKSKDITPVPAGTICEVKETDPKGATSTVIEETPSDGTADGKVTLAGGASRVVTFTNQFPGEGEIRAAANTDVPVALNSKTAVPGENLSRPKSAGAALPRTGGDPWALVATGLWSLSAGALSLAAARLRSRRG